MTGHKRVTFLRLLETDRKAAMLVSIAARLPESNDTRYIVDQSDLLSIPNSPFAYWLTPAVRQIFASNLSTLQYVDTRCGMDSLDDFRFVRLSWERGLLFYARCYVDTPYGTANHAVLAD
jgi:hypothetical protein